MDNLSKERFSKRVKSIRGKRTQAEFAELLGVSQPTITGWEKGVNLPSLDSLERLADIVGVSPELFLASLYGRKELLYSNSSVASMDRHQISSLLSQVASRLISA